MSPVLRNACRGAWLAMVVFAALLHWPRLDAGQPVEDAGKLFFLGRYAEAATMMDGLVRTNRHSPNLWFNLGQARAQAGEPGRAMAAWRQAHRLAPRDGGIRRALAQVREKLGSGGIHPVGWITGWLRDEEWALLAIAASVGLGGAMIRRRLSMASGSGSLALAVALQLLFGGGWVAALLVRHLSANAVVIQREVSAVQAPVPTAKPIRPLADGTEVRVLRTHGDWMEVAVDGNRVGWLPRSAVAVD
jgi:tetratricopeptide (TPR) repeat protein